MCNWTQVLSRYLYLTFLLYGSLYFYSTTFHRGILILLHHTYMTTVIKEDFTQKTELLCKILMVIDS